MVRTDAKRRLIADAIEYLAAHGVGDISLRGLATALGTSHRMLIYHFGSREGLVAAMSAAVEARQADMFRQLSQQSLSPPDLAMAMWRQVTAPDVLPFVRIFFEVVPYAIGRRSGTEAFRDGFVDRWLAIDGLPAAARAQVRLGVAVVRGLLLDLLVTGDHATADAAMASYARTLRPA